jgi:hypothetical protein
MILYYDLVDNFVEQAKKGLIAEKLTEKFKEYFGHGPGKGEIISWENSLKAFKDILLDAKILQAYISVEYVLPYSSDRIDVILFGIDDNKKENAVLIELKAWSEVEDCEIEDEIRTFIGGAIRLHAHPSVQVKGYHDYLENYKEVFYCEDKINLSSCVYCHNYSKKKNKILYLPKFDKYLKDYPVFSKEDYDSLVEYIRKKFSNGQGLEIFNRFKDSATKPTKRLVDAAKNLMTNDTFFILIGDQIDAYKTIIDKAKKLSREKKKSCIIINGGPGTGKSVIALQSLFELLSKKYVSTVYHATGSSAFTNTLRKIFGSKYKGLFKFFNSFTKHEENSIDILICDEAHRIRKTSNFLYIKREMRSELPQIDELIKASRLSVFFIDENQIVRPTEIGNIQLIKETAGRYGAEIYEFDLKTQFRCNGSDGYLEWVDNLLGIKETANIYLTEKEKMEFKIFNSPQELYKALEEKNKLKENSCRLVASYCWKWSDTNKDGTLVKDVKIGDFEMPWEAKEQSLNLAANIPRQSLWAHDKNGFYQVGTVYTVQGFEFEYIGIIFCKDLRYNLKSKGWVSNPKESCDSMIKNKNEDFLKHIKNVYRVLLTRGMKGCYIYFMDKDTEEFFKSRIKEGEELEVEVKKGEIKLRKK